MTYEILIELNTIISLVAFDESGRELLSTGQDPLRLRILFPDWNIKHYLCEANMLTFYFNQVVLAR